MREVFEEIYKTNYWNNSESVSGHGSDMEATEVIRRELPKLVERLTITNILDIPCGDFYWFKEMKLDVVYIGGDIVQELVDIDRKRYPGVDFRVLDATKDKLPEVDLILCRDMLGHFSNFDVKKALNNFRASGSKYLLATTFPDREEHINIETGQWRPINLASFYSLSDPILVINEGCKIKGFEDKSLGLWELDDE